MIVGVLAGALLALQPPGRRRGLPSNLSSKRTPTDADARMWGCRRRPLQALGAIEVARSLHATSCSARSLCALACGARS